MKPSTPHSLRLLQGMFFVYLLVGTNLAANTGAANTGAANIGLATHLATLEEVAGRLQRQIAHPEGRPDAEEELARLIDHLERLQVATAATEAESGTRLEGRRLWLLDHLRRGEPLVTPKAQESWIATGSGVITGRVLSQSLPLVNVRVEARRVLDGGVWRAADTDAQGIYRMSGLEDGSYFVATALYSSLLNETFDNIQCPSLFPCELHLATQVLIAGGSTASSIDFELTEGAKLHGQVFDQEGSPVAGVQVKAYTPDGVLKGSGFSDATGRFAMGRLLAGTYYLAAISDNFIDEVYPDLPCEDLACTLTAGTAIPLVMDGEVTGLDFTLMRRGTLKGQIIDSVSASPVQYADVAIYGKAGNSLGATSTNSQGVWQVGDLDPGIYYLVARSLDHQSMIYDGIACGSSCDPIQGTPIFLSNGATVANLDFDLVPLGKVQGSVLAPESEYPPNSGSVEIYDAFGSWVDSFYWAGQFEFDRLDAGEYFVRARNYVGYQGELWENIPCPTPASCGVVTAGTPIVVALGQTTRGIDLVLEPMGSIEGRILDSGTGMPLVGARANAYDAVTGLLLTIDDTDSQGFYRLRGLKTGVFWVAVFAQDYRSEVWNGIVCHEVCYPASGTSIFVTLGTATGGIDFSLEKLGSLKGTVRDQLTQAGLGSTRIDIFNASGYRQQDVTTAADGTYTSRGLPEGTYYAKASHFGVPGGYLAEQYSGIDCAECGPITSSTPIEITLGNQSSGIDFTLLKGGKISGMAIDAQSGLAVAGELRVYGSQGQYLRSVPWLTSGSYTVQGLEAGSYYLVGDPSPSWLANEVWPGVFCPQPASTCNPLLGAPAEVQLNTTTLVNFAFERLDAAVFRDGFESGHVGNWSQVVGFVEP